MPGPLQLGRIVWTEIADTNGIPRLRLVVIVTPSDRITPTAPLDVIAVTSRVPELLPPDHVLLPWHAQGHPRTRLNRKCAAVCTWVARIRHTDIRDVAGVVPGAVMLEILSKVTALRSPPSDPPAEAGGQSPGGSSIQHRGHGRAVLGATRLRQTLLQVCTISAPHTALHLPASSFCSSLAPASSGR